MSARGILVGIVILIVAWLGMYVVRTYGWLDLVVFMSIGTCMAFLILCAVVVASPRGPRYV